VKIGLATSSRNGGAILRRTGLEELFDARMDGVESARAGLRGKPHPDVFLECLRRLGPIAPGSAVLFEDAAAGARAAKAGRFGLVVGIDRGGAWMSLREEGADWIVRSSVEVTAAAIERWLENREHARPNLLAGWRELERALSARRAALFLDYDGTLTPIVARPEVAVMSKEMRELVRDLSLRIPTAIVSGRGLEDLKQTIGLDSVWYAASHGFDIEGPAGVRHRALPELEPTIHEVARLLRPRVERIPGARVEDKRFSIAVHHRQVDEARVAELEQAVDEIVRRYPELARHQGKKVFDIRSSLGWNKGRAVEWLIETIGIEDALPIYLGDDQTDEDAFAAVRDRGFAVLVTELPRPTHARWSLQNHEEVVALLLRIASRGRSERGSAWTTAGR
jgi:alpha,alpha-trehalase